MGAGALLIKKLKYTPIKLDKIVINSATCNILKNCLVIKKAIAPGAIRRPMDKIIPETESVATIVRESIARRL